MVAMSEGGISVTSHESLEYDFLASPIFSIRGAAATTISHLHAKGDTPIDFPLS